MSQSDEVAAPYGGAPVQATTPVKRVRTHTLRRLKEQGEKFSMLTAYEQYAAQTFDEAGIDVLLVGDSASNNVYANETTVPVTVGDLPFGSYQGSPDQAYATAVRFMKEGLAHCVKLEGGIEMAPQITRLSQGGIPVMAHIGFTPQSEHALGGPRVQGRGDAAERVLFDAHAVQDAGAFAVVMEMVPGDVAAQVTKELVIPTIGIGAGVECDGQVLVWQDAFGLRTGRMASFVKQYADLHGELLRAARAYDEDVKAGTFPGPDQTF
jgi:3-methyl-2-oxobutanoate hydroxymethyltransferase